jgi:hypothetical protein
MYYNYHPGRSGSGSSAWAKQDWIHHGERFGSSLTQTHHTHPTSAAPSNKNIPKVSIASGDAGIRSQSQKENIGFWNIFQKAMPKKS